jgi:hypothetical protein
MIEITKGTTRNKLSEETLGPWNIHITSSGPYTKRNILSRFVSHEPLPHDMTLLRFHSVSIIKALSSILCILRTLYDPTNGTRSIFIATPHGTHHLAVVLLFAIDVLLNVAVA